MYLNDILIQATENIPELTESGMYVVNYGNIYEGFAFFGLKDYSELQNKGLCESH